MKLICWNVRGLGMPRTVFRLQHMLRDINSSVVFLIETKLRSAQMAQIRRRCGFINGIDVDAVGRSGGLSIGWRNNCDVSLRSYSQRHIDVLINDDADGKQWRCTGFYGAPEEQQRAAAWNLLRQINDMPETPWLIIGDFNEIAFLNEKQGGLTRSDRHMREFRRVLSDCEVEDIGYKGRWYTWEKGRFESNNIRERLDRGVANSPWLNLFPRYVLNHLSHSFSDHCPLLLNTQDGVNPNKTWHFRFEASWLLEDSCEPEVQKLWAASVGSIPKKLRQVGVGLENWFRKLKMARKITVKGLKEQLTQLCEQNPTDDILAEITDVKLNLNFEMEKEELYWEQRARVNWMRNGDKNTAFFHRFASQRQKKNKVESLIDDNGNSVDTNESLLNLATSYFTDLFHSDGVSSPEPILEGVEPCITNSMNEKLDCEFTNDEVLKALKAMSPLKASGEDGLGAIFYQRFWHIVGPEVSRFCIELLNGEHDYEMINHTRIVLIPKVGNPERMTQFRPISLCNVLFKIISRMLVNRFQQVLHLCIDEAQSAFVPGRLITDNILLAYEILHSFKNKRYGNKGAFALKLDMSKAYDRVEWDFLESMLGRMGFSRLWVLRIMLCVRTVTYSVVLNGSVGLVFNPTRGIRQGDPLSPYLFLICSEGLSALLRIAASNNELQGARINRYAPTITHLLFADDSLVFGEANSRGAQKLKDLLQVYARCSGQVINYGKSGIFFSRNVNGPTRHEICQHLHVQESENPEKYLGLPAIVGKNKNLAFRGIKEKFKRLTEG
ncbi:hypothetical protein HRI_003932400 [Hibiscus trionum]|uniref:Reverse transcriptase domain-containing protein n=1 Tax=Hibiscus trionum TaxID=183268 RepID=A0A9W7IUL2_HIBTR|nr:hypothetical protein HRI_003932400 [Hibiscus trionum]